jgi:hypothetical protein
VGYQKRPAYLTQIKEAAYNSLIGNTEAGANVFKQRPSPLWTVEVTPGGICLYFLSGEGDARGQSHPRWYVGSMILAAECLAIAAEGSDTLAEELGQEVFDILTMNKFVVDPGTGKKTAAKLIYKRFETILKQAEQALVSHTLFFEVVYDIALPPAEAGTYQDFKTASATWKGAEAENNPIPIPQ